MLNPGMQDQKLSMMLPSELPVIDVHATVSPLPVEPHPDLRAFKRLRRFKRSFASIFWIALLILLGNIGYTLTQRGLSILRQSISRGRIWWERQQHASRSKELPRPVMPSLAEAREVISANLQQIYAALDQGNPNLLRGVIDPRVLADYARLDAICRPFTHRAHYLEAVIQRPRNSYEARVRVLFKPLNEEAQVLVFRFDNNQFLLSDVPPNGFHTWDHSWAHEGYPEWLAVEEQTAIQLARKFMFAAKAKRQDTLRDVVAPGFDTERYVTDTNWVRFFAETEVRNVKRVIPRGYKGLKIEVVLELDGRIVWHNGAATFLVESINGNQKIVWARPLSWFPGYQEAQPGIPYFWQGPEDDDPQLEARTLARFGLDTPRLPKL